jgi:hypothetical protein
MSGNDRDFYFVGSRGEQKEGANLRSAAATKTAPAMTRTASRKKAAKMISLFVLQLIGVDFIVYLLRPAVLPFIQLL